MAKQTTWVVDGNGSINSLSTDQVILHTFFCLLTYFHNQFFRKKTLSGILSEGPDMGPNCLQRLSADDTSR